MGPGFNAVCVVREERNYKSDPPSQSREGMRRTERGRKERGDGGGGGVQLSDEISSAQGLVLGLSIHPSIS